MDNLTKDFIELLAEDSSSLEGMKHDEAEPMESSQSGSLTSTDNSEASENTKINVEESSSKQTEAESKVENTITTRSSKKVSDQRQSRPRLRAHHTQSPASATSMDSRLGQSTASDVMGGNSMSTRSCRRRGTSLSKLNGNQTMKFMENFDPEHSNRERKKLTRQISTSGKRKPTLYDERGVMMSADVDLCDCLDEECPGCHFPCPKCLSNKCGHECRQNRRWTYEEIWFEGTNALVFNPLIAAK